MLIPSFQTSRVNASFSSTNFDILYVFFFFFFFFVFKFMVLVVDLENEFGEIFIFLAYVSFFPLAKKTQFHATLFNCYLSRKRLEHLWFSCFYVVASINFKTIEKRIKECSTTLVKIEGDSQPQVTTSNRLMFFCLDLLGWNKNPLPFKLDM